MMTEITPSDSQNQAIKTICDWYNNRTHEQQVFKLFGYAGTGKTTITKLAIQELGLSLDPIVGEVKFCAYTGKAALVMRRTGTPAQTIHSLIYSVHQASAEEVDKAKAELEAKKSEALSLKGAERFTADSVIAALEVKLKKMRQPQFGLNLESELVDAKLLVLDECFSGDTLVDTPEGLRLISDLKPGDLIYNAAGVDEIVATQKRGIADAVQIKFGGKTVTCSENHPFFTDRGVVFARDIRPDDKLLPTGKAMRFLWNHLRAEEGLDAEVLQQALRKSLVASISGISRENTHGRAQPEVRRSSSIMVSFGQSESANRESQDSGTQSINAARSTSENQRQATGNGPSSAEPRRQWPGTNASASSTSECSGGRMGGGICRFLGGEEGGISDLLQIGSCSPKNDDRDRAEWPFPLLEFGETERCEEAGSIDWIRVDSVELLKFGNHRLDRLRNADGKLYFYDIQAARHHSFSINGCLVHNCSMVGPEIAADLLSFHKPILVLGDPGQLPPIKGEGAFTTGMPDIMLTEIHRQAAESPIIRLATMARQGRFIPYGQHGEGDSAAWKLRKRQVDPAQMLAGPNSQVICGRNATRLELNNAMRRASGFDLANPIPSGPDEKVICLRNRNDIGLINGCFIELSEIGDLDGIRFQAVVRTEDGYYPAGRDLYGNPELLSIYSGHFEDHQQYDKDRADNDWNYRRSLVEATFGWAITCHKAQGSGWQYVIVWDDHLGRTEEDRRRWLYTGITRAVEGLLILD
jgi:hypothetical protein